MRNLTSKLSRAARKGFTLIELIVVIVILGVLMAIGAFAYNSIIDGSKDTAVEASATQLAKTVQANSSFNQKGLDTYTEADLDALATAEDQDVADSTVTSTTGPLVFTVVDGDKTATVTFTSAGVGSSYTVAVN